MSYSLSFTTSRDRRTSLTIVHQTDFGNIAVAHGITLSHQIFFAFWLGLDGVQSFVFRRLVGPVMHDARVIVWNSECGRFVGIQFLEILNFALKPKQKSIKI